MRNGDFGALYNISTDAQRAAFADAPEPAYVALITQEQFAKYGGSGRVSQQRWGGHTPHHYLSAGT